MLHTNIHKNQSAGSREENFMALYHILAIKPSGHVTNIILTLKVLNKIFMGIETGGTLV